eukprot:c12677_g1_i4.p1 GENE.c12677_g1_i4~~c12677_g1_i4.p1  ORF type:complete len:101 (-),score=23.12 c12677_g1_i4:256-558(-)
MCLVVHILALFLSHKVNTSFATHTDLLVVGCGQNQCMLPASFGEAFTKSGVSVEAMSTPNAIGMFNVLNSEDRNVAVALLPATHTHTPERDPSNWFNNSK